MLPYVVAPLSVIAALALISRSIHAWRACRALALTWPLVPMLDLKLLGGSLHGGEVLILIAVPVGFVFSAVVWWLTGKGRPALRGPTTEASPQPG